MSQSDWRSKLTLGIAVALYCAWIGVAAFSTFSFPRIEYQPASYQTEAERDQAHEQADVEAQIWMAYAAWAQVSVGVLGLFGLGITIYFARKAWAESRESAVQARRSADLAEQHLTEVDRGRAHIEIGEGGIEFSDSRLHPDQMRAGVEIAVRNIGARFITLRTMRVEFIPCDNEIALRNEPRRPVKFERPSGFPSIIQPILLTPGSREVIEGRSGRPLPVDFEDTGFYILGRIFYTDHLEIMREAGFCFEWQKWRDEDLDDGFTMYRWSYDQKAEQAK